jgi:hypothetical protein
MMQQWFLDLDGVRSGPYQTPEVLNLIAEGEVLPHHRIAQGLKDQSWINILDWRLDQARQQNVKAEVKESPPTPEKFSSPIYSPDYLEIPMETKPVEKKSDLPPPSGVMPPPLMATPSSNFPYAQPSSPPPQQPIMHPPQREIPLTETTTKKAEKNENLFIPAEREPTPSSAVVPPDTSATAASSPTKPPRDPMAEMFDMLQNTKQKREAKSQQQAQQNHQAATSSAANGGSKSASPRAAGSNKNLGKTLAIGAAITIVGFALGQIFQSAGPPAHSPAKTEEQKASPSPSAVTAASTPTPDTTDRSTDKMIIRNKLAAPPAQTLIKVTTNGQTKTLDHKPTEKELEELKDLKKELQELKALKDELKSNPNGNEENEVDVSGDDGEAAANPNGNGQMIMNGNNPTGAPNDPQYNAPGNPAATPPPLPDVHY